MIQDHQEIFDELVEEQKKKKEKPKEEKTQSILPTFPAKKAKPVVKTAKAGGLMTASKRADGCAQRGKTKGRMV